MALTLEIINYGPSKHFIALMALPVGAILFIDASSWSIDSLESLDFLSAIEKGFSIEVKDSEIMELQTVSDVISLIREKSTT